MTLARKYTRVYIVFFLVVSIPCVLRPLTDAKGGGLFLGKRTANAFWIFRINWFHAVLHSVLSVIGLFALSSTRRSRLYARLNFAVCAVLVGIGLLTKNGTKHIPANPPDDLKNAMVAAVAFAVGFTSLGYRLMGAQDDGFQPEEFVFDERRAEAAVL